MTDLVPSRFDRFRTARSAPGLLLAAFAFGTAVILAGSDDLTRNAIADRAAEDMLASLSQVIPADLHDNDPGTTMTTLDDAVEGQVTVHLATREGRVTALAWELTGYGYGGAIRVLMAADPEGRLLGVRVLSHSETPGLGDKIEREKSDWVEEFAGSSLTDPAPAGWKVKKDGGTFDQFSGATITPRAVVATVHRGLEFLDRNRATLLANPKEAS